jgi:hypothetical protein
MTYQSIFWRTALLLLAALSARGQGFGEQQTYSSGGTGTYDVAVSDLNGDGIADLVAAGGPDDHVGVLLGRRAGGFAAVRTYPTGPGSDPEDVTLGDVNGDGRPDIITGNVGTHSLGVLLGQAGGSFAAVRTFELAAGTTPVDVEMGDLNADGYPDLVAAGLGEHNVAVLLGKAAGGLARPLYYDMQAGLNATDVAVADLSGDGRPDLVTTNMMAGQVAVRLGLATGGFAAVTTYAVGEQSIPHKVQVGDLNGDGWPDLVMANWSTDNVGVLLGSGRGVFGQYRTYSTGPKSQPLGLALGDLNGDGPLDIAAVSSTTSTVAVVPGQAGATFGPPVVYPAAAPPGSIALADVNGDGRLDQVLTYQQAGMIGVRLNEGAYAVQSKKQLPASPAARPVPGPVRPKRITQGKK